VIAAADLNNNPLASVGRPMKVGKEELCGLVAAVERFFAMDEGAQLAAWEDACRHIVATVPAGRGVRAEVVADDPDYGRPPLAPKAVLSFDGGAPAAEAFAGDLMAGEPAVQPLRQGERLLFNPMTLEPGEPEAVAGRVRALLS
jgi:L-seryl-tRNA(Ser) seleniumtransferase